jgi:hypothetical protein
MTENNITPDVNHIIGELSLQVANLTRENAVLRATVSAYEKALTTQNAEPDK